MRIIETRDAELMGRLGKVMQEKHIELYPTFFKPYHQEAITNAFIKHFENPKERVFLWQDDTNQEAIAAYLWMEEQAVEETIYTFGYQRLYLHHVLVMPGYQGQGLGKELLNFADDYAKKQQIKAVEFHYWPNNGIAKHTYKKHGYEVYKESAQKRL